MSADVCTADAHLNVNKNTALTDRRGRFHLPARALLLSFRNTRQCGRVLDNFYVVCEHDRRRKSQARAAHDQGFFVALVFRDNPA